MLQIASKLFNIRADEWRRFLILSLILFLFILGITWAQIVIPAAFVAQVGGEFLPYIFIAESIVIILTTALYSAFVDRVSHDRVMVWLGIIGVFGIVPGRLLLESGRDHLAYPYLYLLFRIIIEAISIHMGTFLNSYYDTRAAKRIIPLLFSVLRVAVIIAGMTVPLLNELFDPETIIVLWAATLAMLATATAAMPYLVPDVHARVKAEVKGNQLAAYISNIREGYRFVLQSPYLQSMAFFAFMLMMLVSVLNFMVLRNFEINLENSAGISNFTGTITGLSSLILLPFQLFIYSRLVARLGVGNTALIYPLSMLIVSALMMFLPEALILGGLAYFAITTYNVSMRATTEVLLYNAVPVHIKGRANAFIGGLVVPLGTMVAGVLTAILIQMPADTVEIVLAVLLGVIALGYTFSGLIVRQRYAKALITLLEQENYSFLFNTANDVIIADSTTLNYLKTRLKESTDPGSSLFLAKILTEAAGNDAVPILDEMARNGDPEIKAGVLDILIAADLRDNNVRQLYTDFLAVPDPRVRKSAITGLEQLDGAKSEQFLIQALKLLRDSDLEVQTQVLPALLQANEATYREAAEYTLQDYLNSDDPSVRTLGAQILGEVGSAKFILMLFDYLNDPADSVRLASTVAIENMVAKPSIGQVVSDLVLQHMPPLLQDPVERIRVAAIRTLGKVNGADALKLLLPSLTDASLRVRETTADVMVATGNEAVTLLTPLLNQDNFQQRKMATAVLTRINREQYQPMLYAQIKRNLTYIYTNLSRLETLAPLASYPSIGILQGTIIEYNEELLDEIFYLLSALRDRKSLNVITETLGNDDPLVRANAAEALETVLSTQLTELIMPLYNPQLDDTARVRIGREQLEIETPDRAAVIRGLLGDTQNPWFRVIVAFALGEMGATVKLTPANGSSEKKAVNRRKPPTDLLGIFADGDGKKADSPAKASGSSKDKPLFTLDEIQVMLQFTLKDANEDVRIAARAAKRIIDGKSILEAALKEGTVLSAVEKIIFLKGVPFFQGMTINQLKVLANVCEETLFPTDKIIFDEGDPGGTLYVVVNGKVGIERRNKNTGTSARLNTVEMRSYFGEASLFDNSQCTTTAISLQDTLTLRLSHEPLVALMQEYPDLSLELIKVLSKRLQETNDQVANLSRNMSRSLHKVYDKLD